MATKEILVVLIMITKIIITNMHNKLYTSILTNSMTSLQSMPL